MKKIALAFLITIIVSNYISSQETQMSKGILELKKEFKSFEYDYKKSESVLDNLLQELRGDPNILKSLGTGALLNELKDKESLSIDEMELYLRLRERNQLVAQLDSIGLGIEEFEKNGISNKEKEDVTSDNYSVPDFPALSFISANIDNVSKPSSARELATNVLNVVDASGRLQQGLAVEFKPFTLLGGNSTVNDYTHRNLKSILYDTQVSFGTVATSGDSTKTDLGWGIRIVLLDNSNLMRKKSFVRKLGDALLECAPASPDAADEKQELECLAQKLAETKEYFENNEKVMEVENYHDGVYWNADWLTLSYAGGMRLNDSNINEGSILGHEVWLAGGTHIGKHALWSFQAKWSRKLRDTSDEFLNELNLGTRLEFRLDNKVPWNLFGETFYSPLLNKDDFENDPTIDVNKEFTWSAGTEFKVAKGFWAVVGFGDNSDRIVGDNGIQLLTGLRIGIQEKKK